MTIKDCIDIVDNNKPNQYTIKDKVRWLSLIEKTIIDEVLKTHEGYNGRYDDFAGYSEDKLSVTLVVPFPHDQLYVEYLKMMIDKENGETARYNNSATSFNKYMSEYRKEYNKTHMPLKATGFRRDVMPPKRDPVGLSDAEYENIKKDLAHVLTEYFSSAVSPDKLYDAVKNYVQNNMEMFKRIVTEMTKPSPIKTTIRLIASAWEQESENKYSQVVYINGVTKYSKVDLQPTSEQLAIFYEKDVTFVAENEGGTITVYCIGKPPSNNYNIQATITEVDIDA